MSTIGGLFDGNLMLQKVFEFSTKYVYKHRHELDLGNKVQLVAKSIETTTDAFEVAEKGKLFVYNFVFVFFFEKDHIFST